MIRLTKHSQEAIGVRGVAFAWIEEAVSSPDLVEADPRHPDRSRSYKAIAEFGGRVLRVVQGDDIVVITVHFVR